MQFISYKNANIPRECFFFTVKVVGITAAAASAAAAMEVGRARVLFDKALSGCSGKETTNAIVVDAFLWRRATHGGSILYIRR